MNSLALRGLWLAIGLTISLMTATAGGVLTYLSGTHPATAVLAAAGAFAATAGLIILILNFLMTPPGR
jgi:hypothetical protein